MTESFNPASYVPCRRVGDGRQHHFFGYYNKSNWDRSNRLLAGQCTPADRKSVV